MDPQQWQDPLTIENDTTAGFVVLKRLETFLRLSLSEPNPLARAKLHKMISNLIK